ncbi:hypothetical protein SHKM778_04380 [Streptomyces sp. KM77-8]|uniref:Protein kinase domain-containing protein n=1 Tax=Streptomyces haneummycinicus TaxID=3074435 RepID=A0AAT9H9R1_9ACTN
MKPLESGDPIRLGPYRVHSVLGEGGMGKVYAGQDGEGRVAAVKVLHPHLAHDADLTRRFVREAQMARVVTTETVARVLDARTDGGRPWIATEFLTGPTLAESVQSHGPLDEPTVRALAAALARALRDIHAAGLVHRDLKPANIVLTTTGPRVIDFGIARPEHGLTLTTTGQTPVTPATARPNRSSADGSARRQTSSPWAPSSCTPRADSTRTKVRTSPPCSTRSSTARRDWTACRPRSSR